MDVIGVCNRYAGGFVWRLYHWSLCFCKKYKAGFQKFRFAFASVPVLGVSEALIRYGNTGDMVILDACQWLLKHKSHRDYRCRRWYGFS